MNDALQIHSTRGPARRTSRVRKTIPCKVLCWLACTRTSELHHRRLHTVVSRPVHRSSRWMPLQVSTREPEEAYLKGLCYLRIHCLLTRPSVRITSYHKNTHIAIQTHVYPRVCPASILSVHQRTIGFNHHCFSLSSNRASSPVCACLPSNRGR